MIVFRVIVQSALIMVVHLSPQYDEYQGHHINTTMSTCHHNFSYKSKTTGIFSSPNFPNNYPDDSTCTYFFQAAPSGRVHISFDFFNLEKRTNRRCTFDYIEIYDISQDGYKKSVDRYCGSSFPKEFVSLLDKMEIVFKSDFTKQSNGFLGHYQFLGDNWQPFGPSTIGCGPGFLTGLGGLIQSPNYPGKYPMSTKCTWIIKVKETQKVLLTLLDLDLSSSSHTECKDTVLMVYYDFAILSSFPEEKYCGSLQSLNNPRKEMLSITSRLVVRFETSKWDLSTSTGFKLVWTAVDLVDDGRCDGFLCNGGTECSKDDPKCTEPVTKYCIHNSLKCNNLPNCGAVDISDEQKCTVPPVLRDHPRKGTNRVTCDRRSLNSGFTKLLWIVLYAAIPTLVVISLGILILYCYRRQKRKQLHVVRAEGQMSEQTHWVSPHIRNVDYSPVPASSSAMHTTSFISKKYSKGINLKEARKSSDVMDVKFNGSADKNSMSSGTKAGDATMKHKVVPCPDKEEITHVQLESVENFSQNFKTHQKRSSYHLMQELNIDDGSVVTCTKT